MPKPVLPSHDSASYELLSLAALCGEFPCDSAARLISSESYRKKIVTGLTHNRLLRIFSRNHLRGYRLGIRGKRLLQDQEPERFLFYLSGCGDTNAIKSEPSRRLRLHRIPLTNICGNAKHPRTSRSGKPLCRKPHQLLRRQQHQLLKHRPSGAAARLKQWSPLIKPLL